ncbi:MAG: hypothetical protein CME70_04455 [Halobacteriovorax sp.]|nr:hypothetical protein [Halobacteriovorax sp.]
MAVALNFFVDLTTNEGAPYVRFNLAQSGPNQVFLNAVDSFDPYEFIGMTIDWGDGSEPEEAEKYFFTHNYASSGTYNVTVSMTSESGLTTSLSKEITVDSTDPEMLNPVANYEVYVEFEGENTGHVRFLEQYSGSPNGEIISYHWAYGDGSTGTGSDVVHFYNPGVYFATLTVTDFAGKTDSQTQRVVVTESGADLIAEVSCFSDNNAGDFICDVLSVDKTEELTEIQMNWGDGTIEILAAEDGVFSENRFTHQYEANGSYLGVATAITSRGDQVSSSVTLIKAEDNAPIAMLSCSLVNFDEIECNPNGSSDDLGISEYNYNFGDGNTLVSNDGSPVRHTYSFAGMKTISLQVVDTSGQVSAPVQAQVTIEDIPVISINCLQGEIREVDCSSTSSHFGNTVSSYSWIVSNGDSYTGESVSFSVSDDNDLTASLRIDFDNGFFVEKDSLSLEFKKAPIPDAFISELPFLANPNTSFSATSDLSSAGDSANIIQRTWKLNDVEYSNDESVIFENLPLGTHEVSLTIINEWDNSSTMTRNVLVNGIPLIGLNTESFVGTVPFEISVDASTSTDPEGKSLTFTWTDEDGEEFNSGIFNKTITTTGEKILFLKVSDEDGSFAEAQIPINASAGPAYIGEENEFTAIVGREFSFTPRFESNTTSGVASFNLSIVGNQVNHSFDSLTGEFTFTPVVSEVGKIELVYEVTKDNFTFNRSIFVDIVNPTVIFQASNVSSGQILQINAPGTLEHGLELEFEDGLTSPVDLTVKKVESNESTKIFFETVPKSNVFLHLSNLNESYRYTITGRDLTSDGLFHSRFDPQEQTIPINKSQGICPFGFSSLQEALNYTIITIDYGTPGYSEFKYEKTYKGVQIISDRPDIIDENFNENMRYLIRAIQRNYTSNLGLPKTIFLSSRKNNLSGNGIGSVSKTGAYTESTIFLNGEYNATNFRKSIDVLLIHELAHIDQFNTIGCRESTPTDAARESIAEDIAINGVMGAYPDIAKRYINDVVFEDRSYYSTVPSLLANGLESTKKRSIRWYEKYLFWDFMPEGHISFINAIRDGFEFETENETMIAEFQKKKVEEKGIESLQLAKVETLIEVLKRSNNQGSRPENNIDSYIGTSSNKFDLTKGGQNIGPLGLTIREFNYTDSTGAGCSNYVGQSDNGDGTLINVGKQDKDLVIYSINKLSATDGEDSIFNISNDSLQLTTVFNNELYYLARCITNINTGNFSSPTFELGVFNNSLSDKSINFKTKKWNLRSVISNFDVDRVDINGDGKSFRFNVTASGSTSEDTFGRNVLSYRWLGGFSSGNSGGSSFSGYWDIACGSTRDLELKLRVEDHFGSKDKTKTFSGVTPDCPEE